MKIINTTSLQFQIIESELITRAVYEKNDLYSINKDFTYNHPFRIPEQTSYNFRIHDLSQEELRLTVVNLHQDKYLALNSQNFWSYLKTHFKGSEAQSKIQGQYFIPALDLNQTLIIQHANNEKSILNFESLPWSVSAISSTKPQTINPKIRCLEYYPGRALIEVFIAYPIQNDDPETYIKLEYNLI